MINQETLQLRLDRINAHIRQTEQNIAIQQEIIRRRQDMGHDTTLSRENLATFIEVLRTHYMRRDLLLAHNQMFSLLPISQTVDT